MGENHRSRDVFDTLGSPYGAVPGNGAGALSADSMLIVASGSGRAGSAVGLGWPSDVDPDHQLVRMGV